MRNRLVFIDRVQMIIMALSTNLEYIFRDR